jgi:hypothetical protein
MPFRAVTAILPPSPSVNTKVAELRDQIRPGDVILGQVWDGVVVKDRRRLSLALVSLFRPNIFQQFRALLGIPAPVPTIEVDGPLNARRGHHRNDGFAIVQSHQLLRTTIFGLIGTRS